MRNASSRLSAPGDALHTSSSTLRAPPECKPRRAWRPVTEDTSARSVWSIVARPSALAPGDTVLLRRRPRRRYATAGRCAATDLLGRRLRHRRTEAPIRVAGAFAMPRASRKGFQRGLPELQPRGRDRCDRDHQPRRGERGIDRPRREPSRKRLRQATGPGNAAGARTDPGACGGVPPVGLEPTTCGLKVRAQPLYQTRRTFVNIADIKPHTASINRGRVRVA